MQTEVSLTLHNLSPELAAKVLSLAGGKVTKVRAAPVEETDDDTTEETDSELSDFDNATISDDALLEAFSKYIKAHKDPKEGRTAAKAIMKKFKVEAVSEIPSDERDEVLKLLTVKKK